jgi:predicted nucleic acid-binding protein
MTSTVRSPLADLAVVDASPLVFLARVDMLDMLRLVASELVVPDQVFREVTRRDPPDAAATALPSLPWLRRVHVQGIVAEVERCDVGPGESAVLAVARAHPGSVAVLDDLAARRCAVRLGIPTRGTVGILLLAKQLGAIPSVGPVLTRLRQTGMYLSDRVMRSVLNRAGE